MAHKAYSADMATEVDALLGDSTKAKQKLGWQPKITFKELVKEMVYTDLSLAKKEKMYNDIN